MKIMQRELEKREEQIQKEYEERLTGQKFVQQYVFCDFSSILDS